MTKVWFPDLPNLFSKRCDPSTSDVGYANDAPTYLQVLRVRRRRSRREAVAAHDFGHLRSVWRTTSGCVDHLGSFAEILRTNRRRRDHAERLRVLDSVVVEPVNGAARNTQCLSRADVDLFSVDGPGQHSV